MSVCKGQKGEQAEEGKKRYGEQMERGKGNGIKEEKQIAGEKGQKKDGHL